MDGRTANSQLPHWIKETVVGLGAGIALAAIAGKTVWAEAPQAGPLLGADEVTAYSQIFDPLPPEVTALSNRLLEQLKNPAGGSRQDLQSIMEQAGQLRSTMPRGVQDELLLLTGLAAEGQGQYKDAVKYYTNTLDLRPSDAFVLRRRAAAEKKSGGCQAALSDYREVLWRIGDKNAPAPLLVEASECLSEAGETEQAKKYLAQAFQVSPTYVPGLKQVIAAQEETIASTKNPKARAAASDLLIQYLGRAYAAGVRDKDMTLKYARLLLSTGDPLFRPDRLKSAEDIAEDLAKDSRYADAQIVKLLFDAQVKRGELDSARKTITHAQETLHSAPELAEAKKQLALMQGDSETVAD